jgi:8-amino-7-oxononanoate synthase
MEQSLDSFLQKKLKMREKAGSKRSLSICQHLIDFASNDYLGFAKSGEIEKRAAELVLNDERIHGSTGSRLLTGNSSFIETLEQQISAFHKADAALIFNSGYDANLGLLSSVPQRGDTVLYDEYIHASARDGIRLSHASSYSFKHNDITSIKNKLKQSNGKIFIVVESVYSMDGDFAPLKELVQIADSNGCYLIVDEAHATGIFGSNGEGRVVEEGLENKVFARIHTFSKALGQHGAVVLGSHTLREYLINFSRPLIYSTALPLTTLKGVKTSYDILSYSDINIKITSILVNLFKAKLHVKKGFTLIDSQSPIQCIIIPGNERVKEVAEYLQLGGFDVRPILSPTVPAGKERVRVCIHSFNTEDEILRLCNRINEAISLIAEESE